MKHAILATLAIIAMTALSGCLMGDPEVDGQQRWNIRDLARHPDLDGVFVSGHLGNYTDCRDQGYTEADGQDRASAPANDADVGFGACQPTDDGDGSCGSYPLNCEDAQFTIELSNKGEITARGVSIERIELLDGVIVNMSPQNSPHAATIHRLLFTPLRTLGEAAYVRVQATHCPQRLE